MARSFAAAPHRGPLRRWLVALALLMPGCADPITPVAYRAATASVEQTTQEHASTLGANFTSRQQHLERLGLRRWHARGFRGRGVTVAILDSGFRGYRGFLDRGLPHAVRTRSFRVDRDLEARDSQHGILCAEVVHAVAPEADLLFATWEPDSPQAFLDAVRWARAEGARVISCSLIMPGWSDGEGRGATHDALAALLGPGHGSRDLLCFASAGNTAERHWSGRFCPDPAGWHQWMPGQTDNPLTPCGSERVAVEVYGPTRLAYDIEIVERTAGTLVASTHRSADPTHRGRTVVRFEPAAGATYAVRLRGPTSAATADRFHVVVLGGSLEHATAYGSVAFPGDGANVHAVGAVDGTGRRINYSSCGPNSPVPKPDFVATVPFPSQCRDRPFAGTSAAAPQAAGLAAVLLSRAPQAAPTQIIAALRAAALDLGPPGHDCETGYGLLRLPD